jgi:hypothetical protein
VSASLAGLLFSLSVAALSIVLSPEPARVDDARVHRTAGVWQLDGRPVEGWMTEALADGTSLVRQVRAGRAHGIERTFYPGGQLRALRYYDHGAKVGVHRGWWPDGTLQFERRFEQGVAQGLSRTWHANGGRFEEHRYEDGSESGLQQLWYADGQLRASYEVRDGRRYGWIGAKPCITDPHDVTAGAAS